MPPEDLRGERVYVWQAGAVLKVWQARAAGDAIDLRLGSPRGGGVGSEREEQGVDGRDGLKSR